MTMNRRKFLETLGLGVAGYLTGNGCGKDQNSESDNAEESQLVKKVKEIARRIFVRQPDYELFKDESGELYAMINGEPYGFKEIEVDTDRNTSELMSGHVKGSRGTDYMLRQGIPREYINRSNYGGLKKLVEDRNRGFAFMNGLWIDNKLAHVPTLLGKDETQRLKQVYINQKAQK